MTIKNFVSLTFFINLLFFSLVIHAEQKNDWRQVKCDDGFKMQIHFNKNIAGSYDFAQIENITYTLSNGGPDSDYFFVNGSKQIYMAIPVVLPNRIGRIYIKSGTTGRNHENCQLVPSVDDLKCKFLGQCQ